MSKQIESELNRLRNLPQYRDRDEKFLKRKASENLKKQELEFEFVFSDNKEKKRASQLFSRYIESYSFPGESELNALKSLVYNEICLRRFEIILTNITNENQNIPPQQIDAIIKLQKQIADQKKQLGLMNENEDISDGYKAVETLFKKFRTYQLEHPDEFYCKCPVCQENIMWNFRINNYDPKKNPLLKNNKPWNQKVIDLIKSKKISIEDAKEILDTSEKYITEILMKNNI